VREALDDTIREVVAAAPVVVFALFVIAAALGAAAMVGVLIALT
jgi:hypothetical protein